MLGVNASDKWTFILYELKKACCSWVKSLIALDDVDDKVDFLQHREGHG